MAPKSDIERKKKDKNPIIRKIRKNKKKKVRTKWNFQLNDGAEQQKQLRVVNFKIIY